jgi:tRNA/tmRNA/rRNA uracil-C5-methylase (TrmA/RlmC/RlmD family)
VFVDEERSEYYLSGTPRKGMRSNPKPLTKLFGREKLFHKVGDLKFLYAPLSFTQTNHSILEGFVGTVKQMLDVTKDDVVADLYCGYGLFSLCLAGAAGTVIAVELSRSAINDGIDNARRNGVTNTKFVCADISADSLDKILKRSPSKVLLDPPRNGTAPGVIEFLAEKKPQRVVHIFCNTEIIGRELQRWEQCGYHPVAVQPVDMFPGTREIEFVVALERRVP